MHPGTGPAARPQRVTLEGRLVSLVPLDAERHCGSLWESLRDPRHNPLWEYMADGPFREPVAFRSALAGKAASEDPRFSRLSSAIRGAPLDMRHSFASSRLTG